MKSNRVRGTCSSCPTVQDDVQATGNTKQIMLCEHVPEPDKRVMRKIVVAFSRIDKQSTPTKLCLSYYPRLLQAMFSIPSLYMVIVIVVELSRYQQAEVE